LTDSLILLPGGKEALICSKGSIAKSSVEWRCSR